MKNDNELKGLSTHCEEIQELMGHAPSWPLRWGITLIAIIVTILLIASCFFPPTQTLLATLFDQFCFL